MKTKLKPIVKVTLKITTRGSFYNKVFHSVKKYLFLKSVLANLHITTPDT